MVGSVLGLSWLKKWVWLAGFIFTGVLVLVALVFVVLPIFFHSLRDPPFIVAIYNKVDIGSLCLLGLMMMVWSLFTLCKTKRKRRRRRKRVVCFASSSFLIGCLFCIQVTT